MSASSKKKLRNAQEAEKLTEKQLKEQAEAKKLKTYSTIFVVVIALMVCFAVYTAVSNTVEHSGIFERNTTALTVGEHKISNAELNYYFIDSVNNFYSNYGSYAAMFGLDVTKPLDEQTVSEDGTTWADDFLDSAIESIKSVYALNDAAKAAGYELSEAEVSYINSQITNMNSYALLYGYPDFDDYLKALYGNGANEEGFRNYVTMSTLASSYQSHYAETLTYEDADLRAKEAENFAAFSSFSYNSYYLAASKFLEGGTTAEDGTVTYSDEENEAARAAAQEAALLLSESTSVEELNAAIAALPINAEATNATSTTYTDTAYSSINSVIAEWVTSADRKAGDIAVLPSVTHTHAEGETHSDDEDTTAFDVINGYYVVLFNSCNDNTFALANVRHVLIPFEGGTYDANTGSTTYSAEEKAKAMVEAEELLASWKEGKATEETFAELANTKSADSDGTDGGLYTDIYPGQMVENFENWCFEEGRQAGDTGIVESPYGYHIMFYSGDSETTYRDYLIRNTLVNADTSAWYNGLLEAMTVTEGSFKHISTDLVLAKG